MPASLTSKEQSAFSRVATLDVFRCTMSKALTHLSERIRRDLAAKMLMTSDDRGISPSDTPVLSEAVTRAEGKILILRRRRRIAVQRIRVRFCRSISGREEQARLKHAGGFQFRSISPSLGPEWPLISCEKKGILRRVLPVVRLDGLNHAEMACPRISSGHRSPERFCQRAAAFIREDGERIR
jgi:hypothetical protein